MPKGAIVVSICDCSGIGTRVFVMRLRRESGYRKSCVPWVLCGGRFFCTFQRNFRWAETHGQLDKSGYPSCRAKTACAARGKAGRAESLFQPTHRSCVDMEARTIRPGFRQAIAAFRAPARRRVQFQQPRRFYATPTESSPTSIAPFEDIRAARPYQFGEDFIDDPSSIPDDFQSKSAGKDFNTILPKLRIVPASPSYFTGKPGFTDDLLALEALLRKHQLLPVYPPGEAPRIAWKTLPQYKMSSGEPVKAARYTRIVRILQRLNYINRSLMPEEVETTLKRHMRDVQPFENKPKPVVVDKWGRARAVGRRKSSNAVVYLVEGDGQVLINGKSITQAFGRVHDRESAIWALKATDRIDKYNVWAVVRGGGCTGQAEALTLGVAKALMVHEPALKPALRRGKFP